jgi:hypothetical protein
VLYPWQGSNQQPIPRQWKPKSVVQV